MQKSEINLQPMSIMGPKSTLTVCPSCQTNISTRVEQVSSTRTHFAAFLLAWMCCCCIPYCVTSCKNTNHYCPNCQAYLGRYTL